MATVQSKIDFRRDPTTERALLDEAAAFVEETSGMTIKALVLDGSRHYFGKGKFSYTGLRRTDPDGSPVVILNVKNYVTGDNRTFETNRALNRLYDELAAFGKPLPRPSIRIKTVSEADVAATTAREEAERAARLVELSEEFGRLPKSDSGAYFHRKGVLRQAAALDIRAGWFHGGEFDAVAFRGIDGGFRGYQMLFEPARVVNGEPVGKLHAKGSATKGAFVALGEIFPVCTLYVAEGVATALTISAAFEDRPIPVNVVACLDCGNIGPVVKAFRGKWPKMRIVVAADDDRWKSPDKNPGLDKARAAATEFDCRVVSPCFDGLDVSSLPTDFNDLHKLAGLDEVRRQLKMT